jgi:FixJ family two-component response regulator
MESEPTVYVVDDDPAILRMVVEVLRPIGLKGKTCSSADVFFAEYRPMGPECLVLDVRMPGMSGLQVQRA